MHVVTFRVVTKRIEVEYLPSKTGEKEGKRSNKI